MKIGLDFDNTIVKYDQVFYDVAIEWGVPLQSVPVHKLAVRDFLKGLGQEDLWTEMQGYVYGVCMDRAELYPGLIRFIQEMRQLGHSIVIISHKTRYPFLGPKYDLHSAARKWITQNIPDVLEEHIFFEATKTEKIQRIAQLGCHLFVDDLPEIVVSPDFPENTVPILFDPDSMHSSLISQYPQLRIFTRWEKLPHTVGCI